MKNIQNVKDYVKNNKFFLLVLLLSIVFLTNFRTMTICGNSMDATLKNNQYHIGTYHIDNIKNGDIVVANSTYLNEQIIKRVIACPGDSIEIKNNVVFVNDVALNENYIKEDMQTPDIAKFTLASNEYFVMGDNRNNSYDSRHIGCITKNEICLKFVI